MFHGQLDNFQKPPLEGRPNTTPGDHGTQNAHKHWFILFYHVWEPAWIKIHWNSIILVEGPVTYAFTLHLRVHDHTTWFWRCLGTTFGHILLGSHNFMVTALGSSVKWPLGQLPHLGEQFNNVMVFHFCDARDLVFLLGIIHYWNY